MNESFQYTTTGILTQMKGIRTTVYLQRGGPTFDVDIIAVHDFYVHVAIYGPDKKSTIGYIRIDEIAAIHAEVKAATPCAAR